MHENIGKPPPLELCEFYCEWGFSSETWDFCKVRYWCRGGKIMRRCWNPFRKTDRLMKFDGYEGREQMYELIESMSTSVPVQPAPRSLKF